MGGMAGNDLPAILAGLSDSRTPLSALGDAFLTQFPIIGVAVSTVGDLLGSETVAASDQLARRVDELQFDLGEGPCWDSLATLSPVLADDLSRDGLQRWPSFTRAAVDRGVASIFAFPLYVGPLRFGAIDMYSDQHVSLDLGHQSRANAMAEAVSRRVLDDALSAADAIEMPSTPFSRRIVHQATGIVFAQLGLSIDDARLIIHGHAFANDRSVMEVAQQIVDGELSFVPSETGIEDVT
jgi:hypothetical protein